MFYNNFKIALRSMLRNRTFSFINIMGLAIGIAFSCMLYLYVAHELSFDSFHTKSKSLYRVLTIDKRVADNPRTYGVTVPALGDELVNHYPEVAERVRLHRFVGQVVFEIDGENFQERNWFTTDPNFFEVFDFKFNAGNKATALKEPFSLVVTESAAKKYFGNEDPIGKTIEHTSFGPVKVTGVIEDQPDNSHLKFDFLFSQLSADSTWTKYLNSWQEFEAFTYIVLNPHNDIASLKNKMPALEKEHFGFAGETIAVDFQPVTDIYMKSSGIEASLQADYGQMSYVYIFGTMGLFLLVIACINYINLATSKALSRAREIGVRKVSGAARIQLILQFLIESTSIALISMIIAIGIIDISFPYFNQITGRSFDITLENFTSYLPPLLSITLLIGLLSGSYPALYMAALKPVASLKGKLPRAGGARVRESLVVFQFTITIVMIVSTMVVGNQMKFIHEIDMGFDKDQLMVIDINSGNVRTQFQAMKNEYARIPGVSHVSVSSRVPGEWKNIAQVYVRTQDQLDSVRSYFMGFDESMLQTYSFEIAEGKYFSENSQADSTQILLNESAVRIFELEEPIGATVRFKTQGKLFNATVIGVLRDFNFQSLHQKVEPIIIGTWNNPVQSIDYFTLKISGNMEEVVSAATGVHEKFDHNSPIEYHFLDDQLNSYYQSEARAEKIFRMGGVLSIFVACLGLLGLATYNIERRTKEMGIRKVLGASGVNLFLLLSSSFTKQVGIAFVIAAPMAYLLMNKWLGAFAFKTSLRIEIFLLSGFIVLTIALLTISFRTLRAVQSNPIDSLKEE